MLQVLVSEMLSAWGPAGLEAHTRTMQEAYARRARTVLAAAGAGTGGTQKWVPLWRSSVAYAGLGCGRVVAQDPSLLDEHRLGLTPHLCAGELDWSFTLHSSSACSMVQCISDLAHGQQGIPSRFESLAIMTSTLSCCDA